jgi:hypothetical protein
LKDGCLRGGVGSVKRYIHEKLLRRKRERVGEQKPLEAGGEVRILYVVQ